MKRLRLLGPLDVVVGEEHVAAGPPKQRLLLALLASRRGRMVSTHELMEELWCGTPPASGAVNLRSYIHGLRRILGADAVTGNGRPGYTLSLPEEALDIAEFLAATQRGEAALAGGQVEEARKLLREALALWRGKAFEGLEEVDSLRAQAAQLEERRLAALELRIDADLYAGAAGALVMELTDLTTEHPYREHLHAQLMVALHRGGRQADALAAYRAVRDTLSHDLGIDPGAELRQLELAILRGESGDPWNKQSATGQPEVPSELPVAVSQFTGRAAEFARLDGMVTAAAPIVAIVGPGGVGKTALALRWAHRVAAQFPDGQLFVDLRGFHTLRPVSSVDALARILRALNVAPERVPPGLDEAAALYRSLMYGRRSLVVLDNAFSADQVRPLLPAGAGCMTLITSRNRMTGLVAHEAASHLPLGPLSVGEGVALLGTVLAADRIRDEPDAAAALVEACVGLPLALRIAAANLAELDGRRIAAYVAELRSGRRLDRLRNEGDERLSVRAAFDLSYSALAEPARRLFAMIGLVPGPDVTAETAAALTGGSAIDTAADLERLAAIHLLERRGHDRYAAHDLAREYARERVSDVDPAVCDAALSRLLTHYSRQADAADRALFPMMLRLTGETTDRVLPERADAEQWLQAELPNLVAACEYAADHGPYEQAWLIADTLRAFCAYRGNIADWATVARAGATAADHAKDLRAQAAMATSVGHCRFIARDFASSVEHFTRALDLSRRADWPEAQASALGNLAAMYATLGDLDRAAETQSSALAINRRIGSRRGEMANLSNLGLTALWQGRLVEAESHLLQSIILCRKDGNTTTEGHSLSHLCEVLIMMDRLEEASGQLEAFARLSQETGRIDSRVSLLAWQTQLHTCVGDANAALASATEAVEAARPTGDRLLTGIALIALGTASAQLGRHDDAAAHHREALGLAEEIKHPYFMAEALIALAISTLPVDREAAADAARQALAHATERGFRVMEGQAMAVLAAVDHDAGDFSTAAALAERALALQEETGWRGGRAELERIKSMPQDRSARD